MFLKYFKNGNCDYIGRCNRHSKQGAKDVVNSSFNEFCELFNVSKPKKYRQVNPNMDASFISISKYDKFQPTLDEDAWSLSGVWTEEHFHSAMSGSVVLPTEDVLKEMDKTTSCGYPWSLEYHSKSEMLKADWSLGMLESYWDVIGSPGPEEIVPIWTCSQKRELRDVEKLAENSHRTFTASPFELSVAANRLYLDQNNGFYSNAHKTWSFVGISKFMGGWNGLYDRLNRHPNAFELDESQYDSSLFARALFGQRDIRFKYLRSEFQTPENKLRSDRIYDKIVHSVIVLENGDLIQKHTGNPSGSQNTITDNTMILYRLLAYAWIVICKRIGRETSRLDFEKHVEAALNGDDNTYTCSDEVVGFFSPAQIKPIWSGIGVTTKGEDVPRKLSECSFLSNGFVWNADLKMWLPEPERERVLSSLMYGSDVDDVRWHLLRACALRIDSYGNKECRVIINDYISYLHKNYSDRMYGDVLRSKKEPISMKEILSVYKTDDWIEALYSGLEGKCSWPYKWHREFGSCPDCYKGKCSKDLLECIDYSENIYTDDVKQSKSVRPISTLRSDLNLFHTSSVESGCLFTSNYNTICYYLYIMATQAQRAARKRRRQRRALRNKLGTQKQMKTALKQIQSFKSLPQRVGRKKRRNNTSKLGVSLVSDGVNTGSIWKNTTAERITFPVAREKICDINGTSNFQLQYEYVMNPGNTALFPIFSQIAKCYEQYYVNHLKFYFRTEAYMASGSVVSSGLIGLAANFDVDAPVFGSMTELENYEHAISGPPYSGVIECDVIKERGKHYKNTSNLAVNNYYVNYGNNLLVPSNGTSTVASKSYDVGTMNVGVGGTQAGLLGELWVEYSFTMIRRVQPATPVAGAYSHWSSITPSVTAPATGLVQQSGATLSSGFILSNGATNHLVLTVPINVAGSYMIVMAGSVLGTGFLGPTVTVYSGGCTARNLWSFQNAGTPARDLGSQATSAATASSGQYWMYSETFDVTVNGGTIDFSSFTSAFSAGQSSFDVLIAAITPGSTYLKAKEQREHESMNARLLRLEKLLADSNARRCLVSESDEDPCEEIDRMVKIPRSKLRNASICYDYKDSSSSSSCK